MGTAVKYRSEMIEAITGAQRVIDLYDEYINKGQSFEVSYNASVGAASTLDILITTPVGYKVQYKPTNITTGSDKFYIQLYEGSTASGGTAQTPYNHDRTSTTVAQTVFAAAPTVTTVGTSIAQVYIPGATGVGGTRNGSDFGAGSKWILKPNTKYTYRIANNGSGAGYVHVTFSWTEEKL